MSSTVAIVYVDDSSNRVLVGISDFDRANGGILLPPRVADATARVALSPSSSELVFQEDTGELYYWNGTSWQLVKGGVVPGTIDHNALANLTAGNPHTQYQLIAEKGQPGGYASLDANGFVVEAAQVLRETGDPSSLSVGSIPNGTFLQRSGATIVGATPPFTPLTNAPPTDVQRNTALVGTSTEAARADHRHDVLTAAPVSIGTVNAEGSAVTLARADHVHAHGAQTDPSLHALAVPSGNAGFLSGTLAQKLVDLPASPPPDTRVLTAGVSLSGGGDLTADRTFDLDVHRVRVSDSTGGQSLSGGVVLLFDTQEYLTSPDFSFSAPGTSVTINTTGTYMVTYGIGVDKVSGNSRQSSGAAIRVNGTVLVSSTTYAYHRNLASGEGFLGCTVTIDLSAGDTIDVFAAAISGSGTLVTVGSTPRLEVLRVA